MGHVTAAEVGRARFRNTVAYKCAGAPSLLTAAAKAPPENVATLRYRSAKRPAYVKMPFGLARRTLRQRHRPDQSTSTPVGIKLTGYGPGWATAEKVVERRPPRCLFAVRHVPRLVHARALCLTRGEPTRVAAERTQTGVA